MNKRKVWRYVWIAAVGLIGLSLVTLLTENFIQTQGLREEILKAKRDGVWVESATSLLPKIPTESNAAGLYLHAFEVFGTQPEKLEQALRGREKHPEDARRVAGYLHQFSPAMALAEKASRMPNCLFEHDYSNPYERYPELRGYRLMVDLFLARTELPSSNPNEVIQDLLTVSRMARHIGQSPTLDSGAVETATDKQVLKSAEGVLTRWPSLAEQLAEVVDALGAGPDVLRQWKVDWVTRRRLLEGPPAVDVFGTVIEPGGDAPIQQWLASLPAVQNHNFGDPDQARAPISGRHR